MTNIDFESDLGKRALSRLGAEQIVWLSTTSANGTPLPTPVWFLWHDDTVLIYSQPDTAKVKAILRNGRVALNFNSDEHGGNVVILKGTAEIVSNGPAANEVPAYVEKYAGGMASLNMPPEQFAAEYSQMIRVTPDRLTGF
jgi:PPOX class probable F420-dependent enzyme